MHTTSISFTVYFFKHSQLNFLNIPEIVIDYLKQNHQDFTDKYGEPSVSHGKLFTREKFTSLKFSNEVYFGVSQKSKSIIEKCFKNNNEIIKLLEQNKKLVEVIDFKIDYPELINLEIYEYFNSIISHISSFENAIIFIGEEITSDLKSSTKLDLIEYVHSKISWGGAYFTKLKKEKIEFSEIAILLKDKSIQFNIYQNKIIIVPAKEIEFYIYQLEDEKLFIAAGSRDKWLINYDFYKSILTLLSKSGYEFYERDKNKLSVYDQLGMMVLNSPTRNALLEIFNVHKIEDYIPNFIEYLKTKNIFRTIDKAIYPEIQLNEVSGYFAEITIKESNLKLNKNESNNQKLFIFQYPFETKETVSQKINRYLSYCNPKKQKEKKINMETLKSCKQNICISVNNYDPKGLFTNEMIDICQAIKDFSESFIYYSNIHVFDN